MKNPLVICYLAASVTFATFAVKLDAYRSNEEPPIVYVVIGGLWPAVGAVFAVQALLGKL